VIFISQQKFSFLLDGMEKRGLRAFFKHFAHVNKNKTLLLKNNYPLTLTHPVKRSFLYTDTYYGRTILNWEAKPQTELL